MTHPVITPAPDSPGPGQQPREVPRRDSAPKEPDAGSKLPAEFPLIPEKSRGKRYGYAALSVAAATTARLVLDHVFGYHHPYATFYLAVLWSAWYGGLGSGLLATGLGAVPLVALVLTPSILAAPDSSTLMGLEFYFIVSLTGVILFEAQRRAERRAAGHAETARQRLQQLGAEMAHRAEAEKTARQAVEHLRLAFEHAPVGIAEIDLNRPWMEPNPEFCAITGYGRDELAARSFSEILHPEGAPAGRERFARLREGAVSHYQEELAYIRPDGAAVWLSLTVTLVREAGPLPSRAIAVIQDVTGRKQAEERIREAQKYESIGMLAGGIAHDFNNLLTGMLGNASLALDTVPAESPARRMLEGVVTAAERAAHLTGELLAYAGKGAFENRDFDLSDMARQTSEIVQLAIRGDLRIHLNLASGLPAMRGDPSQFQQLISNLLINAAESFGEEHAGTIRVSTSLAQFERGQAMPAAEVGEVGPGTYLELRVQDTGLGMDEATVAHIFDPFYTTKFLGRGLGLAAVAGIVRARKGAVTVTTEPGRGSTFTVLFPVEAQR